MQVHETLIKVGIEGKKLEVYFAILGLGSASAQEIAKRANLKRTTVVEILEGFISRGIVSVSTIKRTRYFTAEPPRKLLTLLEEQEREVRAILPELEALFGRSHTKPKVRFYEGLEGIKTVYEDTLTTTAKSLRAILSMRDLYEIPGKDFMDDYVTRRIGTGIKLQVIRSEQKEVEDTWRASRRELRELHLAPSEMIFAMTMYLYDNKVALIGTQKENFGVIFESKDFFDLQSHLFDVLWQVTRVLKPMD